MAYTPQNPNGQATSANSSPVVIASDQSTIRVNTDPTRSVSFHGRAASFRIPGRAGTAGQRILTLWNDVGSPVIVDIEQINVDVTFTVIKAVTVLPPVIRVYRISSAPSSGTVLSKMAVDTSLTSSASVSARNDASADGTLSGAALTATIPTGNFVSQIFAPRLITAVGYEIIDRAELLDRSDEKITLRAGEGIALSLDYVLATQNPSTDMWITSVEWTEYTAA